MVPVPPIKLRYGAILDQARHTLINAGYGPELKRAHNAAQLRQARATIKRAQEQARLKRVAALQANKAVVAIKQAYEAQIKVAGEFDRERWLGLRDLVVSELMRIVEGKRP